MKRLIEWMGKHESGCLIFLIAIFSIPLSILLILTIISVVMGWGTAL